MANSKRRSASGTCPIREALSWLPMLPASGGSFKQSEQGTVELGLDGPNDGLRIKGSASYAGKLRVNFAKGYVPKGVITIITDGR